MKKALSLLIVVCLITTMLPVAAFAAESGSCGANATWTLDGSTLTISGTGAIADYTESGSAPWYAKRAQVRTIVVEEGITSIGDGAFDYLYNATAVQLPSTLTWIGDSAFQGCRMLENVSLPDGVTHIGYSAFYSCSAIGELVLPEGLTELGTHTFESSGLTRIVIPESLTYLPERCFMRCEKLTEVVMHDGITELGDWCFSCTDALENIDLPKGLTEIPWGCFSDSGLKRVSIPDGVTTLRVNAFNGCASLEEVEIPDSVTMIYDHAFADTKSLKTIELPAGLTATSYGLFSGSGLESITLPDGMIGLSRDTFLDCKNLTTVVMPDSMEVFGEYCFARCTSLKSLELPKNTRVVEYGAFESTGLEQIVIPEGCTHVGGYAFSDCDSLTEVVFPDSVFYIGDYTFRSNDAIDTVVLPTSLKSVPRGMFMDSSIREVVIPDGVTTISSQAFWWAEKLEKVVIPPSVEAIGSLGIFQENPLLTVYCWRGSYIQYYCEENEIPYVLMDEDPEEPLYHVWTNVVGRGTVAVEPEVVPSGRYVEFTVQPEPGESLEDLTVYYFSEEELDFDIGQLDEDTYIFQMPACDVLIDAVFSGAEPEPTEPEPTEPEPTEPEPTEPEPTEPEYENPFTDVAETDFYYDAVLWALEEGVTAGTSDNTFSPYNPCQRAQVVTFLWRAMGCPEPVSAENPFTDVKETDFYYKAVLWAVEQGITNGMTANTFGPYGICNRAQVVTFLHRALGKPSGPSVNPFGDVKPGDYYYDAVLWAVGAGVTSGVDASVFGPGFDCVRGQVVTFLYRALAK